MTEAQHGPAASLAQELESARELLESNGYRVVSEHYSIIPLDRGLRVKPQGAVDRCGSAILKTLTSLFPTLFGYQLIFEAKPAGVSVKTTEFKSAASPAPTLRST